MRNLNSVLKTVKDRLQEYKLGMHEYNEKEVRKLQRTYQAISKQLAAEYEPGEWRCQ